MGLLDFGYTDTEGRNVRALEDMFDGGGRGRSGSTFEGGPFSGLLNDVGVRPYGYQRRLDRSMSEPAPRRPSQGGSPREPVAVTSIPQREVFGPPMSVNPVTPYGEAARYAPQGLLAPEPNVAYEPMYTGRGRTGAFEGPAMPVSEGRAGNPRMAEIYSNLLRYGATPQEVNQLMQRYGGYSVPGAR